MFLKLLVFTALPMLFAPILFSCSSEKASVTNTETVTETENQGIPRLTIDLFQEVVYNGKPQPILFHYTGDEKPEIIYYPSPEARKEDRYGSFTAPIRAGVYYVWVRCPVKNKKVPVEEAFPEYRILKCPVKIEAEKIQEAFYNGDPKRVRATAEPSVPLSYIYYPNEKLRDIAQKSAREAAAKANTTGLPTRSFIGYRRVERAPIEQGTYYVWVYFPGDENHKPAEANVEFTIRPPR